MEDQVLPWLMNKIEDFLREDEATINGAQDVVKDGILLSSAAHKATIKARYAAIEKAKQDALQAIEDKKIRKENRRLAREKRAKDNELEKYRDLIERNIIFRGEIKEALKENLQDVHGNYSRDNFIGTVGGHVMQIFYVFEEISNRYPQGLQDYL